MSAADLFEVDNLTNEQVRDEAIAAFDKAMLARARALRATKALAEARIELDAADRAATDAREEMLFWESHLIDRGFTTIGKP